MRAFLQLKPLEGVTLKRETIVSSDIEFVTDRVIKVLHQPLCANVRWTQESSG